MIYGSNIRSCSVRKCPHLVACSLEIHWEMPALVLHMLSRFLFFRNSHLKNAWSLLWTVFCEQGTPVGPCALQIWSRCVRKSVQTKPVFKLHRWTGPVDQFPKSGAAIEMVPFKGKRASCALCPPLTSSWFHNPSGAWFWTFTSVETLLNTGSPAPLKPMHLEALCRHIQTPEFMVQGSNLG